MYELTPKKTNKTAGKLILLLFLGAAALILITVAVPPLLKVELPLRWVFQLIAIFLLTAGIFLTTRYITKLFIYRVTEKRDLTVTEAASNGKRPITVARVGLDGIRERIYVDSPAAADAEIKRLKKEKIKLYDYTVDYQPAESIFLVVVEGGERLALRLSYDKNLYDLLIPTVNVEEEE